MFRLLCTFLILCAGVSGVGLADQLPPTDSRQPNIILIMADDVGIEGFGCYGGSSYKTPHIDRLAQQGVRFTHAYSQPLCTPTRLQIMTGKYNHRNWKYFGIMPPEEKTIGHWMKEAGYKTCIAGKWQLQSYDPPDYPGAELRRGTGMHPKDSGFDTYQLFHSLHTEDKGSRYADPTFLRDGVLHNELKGKYGEDLNRDFIVEFMQKNVDDPFFVYYPMALPHWPMNPTPLSADWADPEKRLIADKRYFADMVEYMDKLVGSIVDAVDQLGLAERTLILFYSDNGTHLSIESKMGDVTIPGGKAQPTQTGVRVPLIARWKGAVVPGVTNDLVDSSDFLVTMMEIAGKPLPENTQHDGVSFASALGLSKGNVKRQPRQSCFFWYDPRPGWDKDQFSRHIFALDHRYKLFSDGRFFVIDDLLPLERLLQNDQLDQEAAMAKAKLQRVIDEMMKEPMSEAARSNP